MALTSIRTFLDFAVDAAWQAGQLTLAHFQTGVAFEQKADMSPVPLYGVLMGLEVEGETVVGVAYFPGMGEMLSAARGDGCRWNGRLAHVSNVSRLDQALLVYTEAAQFAKQGRADAWARLVAATRSQRGWSDCYGYALVATGRAEIMLDPIMNPWDCAALLPIAQEAGGTFSDWDGKASIYSGNSICTNGALFEQVMEIVR
jgi:histidinol-phosphatase